MMAIKCISKNCPSADTNPYNCHFIDCCDFGVFMPSNVHNSYCDLVARLKK